MHPILLQFGDWSLPSYVVVLGVAAVVSLICLRAVARRTGFVTGAAFWLLVNLIVLGAFVSGRLGGVVFQRLAPFRSPGSWEMIWSGEGLPTFGVLPGVFAGVYLFCRQCRADFLRALDGVFLVVPVCHGIARLGCFLAGCCYGRPVQGHIAWAVVFTDPAAEVPPSLLGVPLHPTQLYEAAGDFAIAGALYFLLLPWVERSPARRGILCFAYFLAYGLLRYADEFFRGDVIVQPSIGITTNQALALAAVVGSVSCAFLTARKTWRLSAAL